MEEQTKETEIRLQDLWLVFKRCWWLMLIVLVAVSILAYTVLTLTHEDEYTANVSIYVMNTPDKSEGGANGNFSTTQISMAMYLIKDCLELGKSYDQILQPVMISQNLEGVVDIEELEKMYTITKADDAHVLYLTVILLFNLLTNFRSEKGNIFVAQSRSFTLLLKGKLTCFCNSAKLVYSVNLFSFQGPLSFLRLIKLRKTASRGLTVVVRKILARFVHSLNHHIERNLSRARKEVCKAYCIDCSHRCHSVTLDAGNLNKTANRVAGKTEMMLEG